MKTMTVAEFKSHFSAVIDEVKAGEKIEVTYGKSKEVVGYFVADVQENTGKRKLGILEGKVEFIIKDDFEMTTEELLGL